MTMVATNLRNTRERARLLRFEPVATISATSVQTAIQEVAAEASPVPGPATPVTASPYVILSTDTFVYVNFAGTVALTLPDAAAWLLAHTNGLPLVILDVSNAANDTTNKITITRSGADTINGTMTSIEIVAPMGGYRLRPNAAGSWTIQ